eukprot:CAMPEP_0196722410 /NCGR_PEP_ID=MMETSP1091-20130531/4778_1 /TAXON_ID=302021 /ORGANISM="Rhodomonas sp., Strain CCMP768" /LENGTH=113 /DNA_ID=CAMNT_0042064103 /DNA_START=27 /DNA_END=368 /DNA_ORIENTATION=-
MSRAKKPAVGANVAKFCRESEAAAHNEAMAKKTVAIRAEAIWHERQGQLLISGRMAKDRQMDEMKEELACQRQELQIVRSQRLKELYAREAEQYELELNAIGLASASKLEDQF